MKAHEYRIGWLCGLQHRSVGRRARRRFEAMYGCPIAEVAFNVYRNGGTRPVTTIWRCDNGPYGSPEIAEHARSQLGNEKTYRVFKFTREINFCP